MNVPAESEKYCIVCAEPSPYSVCLTCATKIMSGETLYEEDAEDND